MDNAVTLVCAYLHVNGYFTGCEYPMLEAVKYGGYRTVIDLVVLSFWFPGAGGCIAGAEPKDPATPRFVPDPALGVPDTSYPYIAR